ncbi:D-alanyl-D-alanine carboxypeptidase/D-alanyl-D-alanine-endopeptidase [Ornithinimicrobium panacihumi]|uniref:D-alanyl-D-alanine carboxypeptidase/D-alanyl-D-alanine-endopeptidase n=1 Tax=Ornithinimicrobium panacihumi TaxID=2008449 RepID=UPI003F89448F
MTTGRADRFSGRARRRALAPALALSLVLAPLPGAGQEDDAAVTTQAGDLRPRIRPAVAPLAQPSAGVMPTPEGVTEELKDELSSSWLGPSKRRSITVRDALTGTHLTDTNADRLGIPASTTKILSAAAIVSALPTDTTFTTRVVAGETPRDVVIVAGGDMMLARGEGDPEAVPGRVGIADLARDTAAGLKEQGVTEKIRVHLDLEHVDGPSTLETWTDDWVTYGYAGRIVQLGLAEDLALPFAASPASPPQEVAAAFRQALADEGMTVAYADRPEVKAERVTASPDAIELASGESAELRDVLAHALATSDNAMVEQLARQAAVADGRSTEQEDVTAWVKETVAEDYGLDLDDVRISDTSGLSDGTRIPVSVIGDVLVGAADGSHPALQEVLAAGGLPIAGYTGTLASRFHLPVHAEGIGNGRAKTGSLPGVTSLAGTVVTRDGRLLVYAMTADKIGEDGAVLEARSVLDEIVAQLARCGC